MGLWKRYPVQTTGGVLISIWHSRLVLVPVGEMAKPAGAAVVLLNGFSFRVSPSGVVEPLRAKVRIQLESPAVTREHECHVVEVECRVASMDRSVVIWAHQDHILELVVAAAA
jgi:hypothetical protein